MENKGIIIIVSLLLFVGRFSSQVTAAPVNLEPGMTSLIPYETVFHRPQYPDILAASYWNIEGHVVVQQS